jgi:hypothetical protein
MLAMLSSVLPPTSHHTSRKQRIRRASLRPGAAQNPASGRPVIDSFEIQDAPSPFTLSGGIRATADLPGAARGRFPVNEEGWTRLVRGLRASVAMFAPKRGI